MIGQAITKNSILLGIFAIAVAAGLAGTEVATRDAREKSLREVQSRALEQIIPEDQRDNHLLDDAFAVKDSKLLRLKKPSKIHVARKSGEITAFIIPTRAPDGYGGAIDTLVGIYKNGEIAGVRVIQHQETPGLGDKVEMKKSNWVTEFEHRSLANTEETEWAVKKDRGIFDQFTGATITPRAVVKSIHNSLLFFKQHQKQLVEQAKQLQKPAEGA